MISVSYLSSKYEVKETIKKIEDSNANLIHVDLMDGIYVKNKNFELNEVLDNLKDTTKPLDIHLMVSEPLQYIKEFIKLKNIWAITFHLDSTNNPDEIISFLKSNDIKVGIAVNPDEDTEILNKYFGIIDYVLIMSVIPGKGGQEFIPCVLSKLNKLENKNVLVGIDGGINDKTINYLKKYDIDVIVSGSYICLSDNYNERINILKEALK